METARPRLAEVDAATDLAKAEVAVTDARIAEAESAYRKAVGETGDQGGIAAPQRPIRADREIERLQNIVNGRKAGVAAAINWASQQRTT